VPLTYFISDISHQKYSFEFSELLLTCSITKSIKKNYRAFHY